MVGIGNHLRLLHLGMAWEIKVERLGEEFLDGMPT